MIVLT